MTKAEFCRQLEKFPDDAQIIAHIDSKERLKTMYIFSYSELHNELTICFPMSASADFANKLRNVWKVKIVKK